ncbi:MAG: hypothetical protein DSY77_06535 [Bacteroidetes bacterium]|nr:MAG: hypothetical protein DSY77_06535 [Bacteroidota bacterium]
MRFNRQPKPKRFDERTITKFAFLPITARNQQGRRETRWLERVTVVQKYHPQDSMRESWVTMEFE